MATHYQPGLTTDERLETVRRYGLNTFIANDHVFNADGMMTRAQLRYLDTCPLENFDLRDAAHDRVIQVYLSWLDTIELKDTVYLSWLDTTELKDTVIARSAATASTHWLRRVGSSLRAMVSRQRRRAAVHVVVDVDGIAA